MIRNHSVLLSRDGDFFVKEDVLAEEVSLTLYINGRKKHMFFSSPEKEEYLAVGFMKTEGIINSAEDINELIFDHDNLRINVELIKEKLNLKRKNVSKPENPKNIELANQLCVSQCFDFLNENMNNFTGFSKVFKKTGAVHCAAIYDRKEMLICSEDVSRYNAVYKIVGEALLRNIEMSDKVLFLTCRISSDMVDKIHKSGIGVVVSRSAATYGAVCRARALRLNIVGFVRENRFTVY